MHRMFVNFITILAMFAIVKSAKIFVFSPVPLKSHQIVFRPLIQELINRKHEVTAITTDPVYPQGESPNNLKEINLHDLSYSLCLKVIHHLAKVDQNNLTKVRNAFRWLSEIFKEQLKDNAVSKLLKDAAMKFDLLIIPVVITSTLIFTNIFGAPVIFLSTFGPLPGNMKTVGAESHPLIYPTHYHTNLYNLTLWEKIYEMYIDKLYNNIHENQELKDDIMLKSVFGIKTPTVNELKNNVHMLFLKAHPLWLHNQPVPLNVVHTWGIHKPSENMLPKELQSYLDSAKNGVIYISFGTLLKTSEVPPERLEIFVKVFSRLPYNILWKWDADELPGISDNIRISKWFPQYDVLRHPNLKLFITHGGLQSTDEAINAGVPLIGIPQYSDQEYNTEKYRYFKIGIKLDYNSLTIESLENAIKSILSDSDSYKQNIIQLRTQMSDQPKPALEHVMWWVEYVLRHGGVEHLRAPAANMSWVEYYELEIILHMLCAMAILCSVFLVAVYTCILRITRPNLKIKEP